MKGEFISIETARIQAEIEKENKELQERIDKAIEYIEKHFHWGIGVENNITKILNILQGEENEEKFFEEHYYEIYERYCEEHPEEITSDFILEEDGNWDEIDEIIEELIAEMEDKNE